MTRVATADVTLPSSGLHIPKGTMLAVLSSQALRDPAAFPDQDCFTDDRFVRLTEADDISSKWQYATTSAQHFGFGHGAHACPKRFLAADILKVTLARMLPAYAWCFPEGHCGKNIDQLDQVEKYCKKGPDEREKNKLEKLTIGLHTVSQDTDSLLASADMASMILRRVSEADLRYANWVWEPDRQNAFGKPADAISYLSASVESQVRWLASYKSRKDIAMNLVFNLTQQDASMSTNIALEAKAEGTSMKIIAALTMVFLPGTFLSSVFGMSSLKNARWWLYIAITIPLTVLVTGAWWGWLNYSEVAKMMRRFHR